MNKGFIRIVDTKHFGKGLEQTIRKGEKNL